MTMVVGLTGGIGSGKSAVADAFATLGVEVTDADRISHALTLPGRPGFDAIIEVFGRAVLDAHGAIDRGHLRQTVFADSGARMRLENALHPLIRAAALREVHGWTGPYGIVVVPLLLERGGLVELVDRILVVDCPEDEQVRRAVRRSGLAAEAVRSIMAAQCTRAQRIAAADDVLDNGAGPERIAPQVTALDHVYRTLAAVAPPGAPPAA